MYTIYVLTISSLKMFVRNRQRFFLAVHAAVDPGDLRHDEHGQQSPTVVGVVKGQPNTDAQNLISQLKENTSITVKENTLEGAKAGSKRAISRQSWSFPTITLRIRPRSRCIRIRGSRCRRGW